MHLYFYTRCNGNDMGKIYVEIQGGVRWPPLPLPGGAHADYAQLLQQRKRCRSKMPYMINSRSVIDGVSQ